MLGKVEKLLGRDPGPFARSLEIGAGTGYFSSEPAAGGRRARGRLHGRLARDARHAARQRGAARRSTVETAACDAAALPFGDEEFDLVLGHAVLHHLPELDRAFAEFRRVLRPGGVLLFAGEPSRHGDRIAAVPKRAGLARRARSGAGSSAPARGRRNGHARRGAPDDHALESVVDVHAFTPGDLERHARAARLRGRPRPRRGAARQLVRLVQPHRRGDRAPRGDPARLVPVRLPRLHRAAEGRRHPAGAAPPAGGLLQPDAHGAASRADGGAARRGGPAVPSCDHRRMPALVVLGARNLGRAVLHHFRADGWEGAAVARSAASLDGLDGLGIRADASDPDALRGALAEARERLGGLDLIVNAVSAARPPQDGGPFGGGPLAEATARRLPRLERRRRASRPSSSSPRAARRCAPRAAGR